MDPIVAKDIAKNLNIWRKKQFFLLVNGENKFYWKIKCWEKLRFLNQEFKTQQISN
jgi:hypothetical protein